MITKIKKKFPQVKCIKGDIQKKTGFNNNYFDKIQAIHVLEYLANLPKYIKEILFLIKGKFKIIAKKYFPYLAPFINYNLCLGLTLRPIKTS